MKTAVPVEKLSEKKFRASTSHPIPLESEGRSGEEAVKRLCALARKELAAGQWQQVTLPGLPQSNPWIAYAGIWKDHPDFDDFLKNMADCATGSLGGEKVPFRDSAASPKSRLVSWRRCPRFPTILPPPIPSAPAAVASGGNAFRSGPVRHDPPLIDNIRQSTATLATRLTLAARGNASDAGGAWQLWRRVAAVAARGSRGGA